MIDWILTDDDSHQHVRKIDDHTFKLIEIGLTDPDKQLFQVYTDTVCLSDYPEGEVGQIIRFFGYDSLDHVQKEYGDRANQIIAECIFEHYGSFAAEPLATGLPFEQARSFIEDYIKTR